MTIGKQRVFCPSLEKGMVESELFEHQRGAFTSAVADSTGKVPAAERRERSRLV